MRGLIFESRQDRQRIFIDPSGYIGSGSMRTVVKSNYNKHVVLFDHVIRNKIWDSADNFCENFFLSIYITAELHLKQQKIDFWIRTYRTYLNKFVVCDSMWHFDISRSPAFVVLIFTINEKQNNFRKENNLRARKWLWQFHYNFLFITAKSKLLSSICLTRVQCDYFAKKFSVLKSNWWDGAIEWIC